MNITVTYGTGSSKTEKGAFHEALKDAGIARYNLVKLSSVIPPGSEVNVNKESYERGSRGDRLYVVMSKGIETTRGEEACAGLGWYIGKDGGIFIEETGSSEKEVEETLETFLGERLSKEKQTEDPKDMKTKATNIECNGETVCALIAAVYKHETW